MMPENLTEERVREIAREEIKRREEEADRYLRENTVLPSFEHLLPPDSN